MKWLNWWKDRKFLEVKKKPDVNIIIESCFQNVIIF